MSDSSDQAAVLHKLQERVKELTALHKTARLLQDDRRAAAEVVRDVAALLPAAWQYPEIAAARIVFRDIEAQTAGFRDSPWMQRATIKVQSGIEGVIEIAYLEERSSENGSPFLPEETDLIESLAEMLRSYFQHKLADEEVQAAYDHLESLVGQRTQELRRLAAELSLAEARKDREIATTLHDHVIQEFAFIKMRIQEFHGDAVFCGFEQRFDEIVALLDRAIHHTRQLTFEISPPILYELGLPAALEWLAELYESRHHLKIRVYRKNEPPDLSEELRVTLFRCTQELLTNAVKYARATTITIMLDTELKSFRIEVRDNGIGFDPQAVSKPAATNGFGLFSIRERLRYFGGSMQLDSAAEKGTTILLTVPTEKS